MKARGAFAFEAPDLTARGAFAFEAPRLTALDALDALRVAAPDAPRG
jgi:hypothetical protein